MRVLITGGAGYIGSQTAKALAIAGHQPIVLDNLSCGHRWAVKWGPFAYGDLKDQVFVRETIESYQVDSVIHFAAHAQVAESMKDPHKYLHGNVAISFSLLEAMRQTGVRQIVFSSSCATYGIPKEVPICETTPQVPVNPYGESKQFIERTIEAYGRAHGFSWVALRYFNAAGADPDGELGEEHEPESHLIPLAIQAALGERDTLDICGTDYPTPDGTAIRDYIHVYDLASAHVLALEHLHRGGESGAFNLGTAHGHSVLDMVRAVEKVSGRRVPARKRPRRAGDPPILIARSDRAQEVLGWQPRYASLTDIVDTAIAWHASRCAKNAVAGD